MNFDVCIIGAGPIGICCAIEAKKNNLSYLILDRGCLVNSLYNYPKNMTFFSTSDKLEIGDVPFISHNSKPTKSEALEYYRRVVSSWDLKINLYEEVTDIIKETATAGTTSSGNIATIAFPMTPGTTHAQAIKAVDPFGKIFKNAKKKRKEIYKMGYSPDLLAYRTKVKDIYPMLKR